MNEAVARKSKFAAIARLGSTDQPQTPSRIPNAATAADGKSRSSERICLLPEEVDDAKQFHEDADEGEVEDDEEHAAQKADGRPHLFSS